MLDGFTQILSIEFREYACYTLCFITVLIFLSLYQMTFLFAYRYAQTTQNDFLLKYLENPRIAIGLFITTIFFEIFCHFIPMHASILRVETVENYLYAQNLTFLLKKYSKKVIIAADVSFIFLKRSIF